jgi:hypothetical protein
MKRRKKPVLLITVLVVLLGAVVVMSMPPGGIRVKDPNAEVTGEGREAPTAASLAGDLKKNVLTAPKKAIAEDEIKGPSIAVHPEELGYQKPVPPPDGTTSSQWYTSKK